MRCNEEIFGVDIEIFGVDIYRCVMRRYLVFDIYRCVMRRYLVLIFTGV